MKTTPIQFEMEEQNEKMLVELRAKYGENIEVRTHEIRAHKSNEMVVEGYASVFDTVYNIGFDETVDRGAFDNVLDDDVRFFFDHGGTPLARTKNGTLKLSVDDTGLHYRAELNDTTAGRDLFAAIKRGDVSQSSFAFQIETESRDANGVRHIERVSRLLDVSAVSVPASPSTVVEARKKIDDVEQTPKLRQNSTKMETGKMTISDMKAKRAQLSDEFAALAAGIEAENRTATDNESEHLDNLDSEITKLDGFIETRERSEKQAKTAARMANVGISSTSEAREIRNINKSFSLSRAIAHVANGRPLMGAELEWAMEAQNEARGAGLRMQGQIGLPTFAIEKRAGAADDFQAGSGDGSGFVPTSVPTAIGALHTPSFTESLGVEFLQATGSLQMPRVSVRPVATAGTEVASESNSDMEMDEVTLQPNRHTAATKYSKTLLLQGGNQVDTFIARQIVEAHNRQIDAVTFKLIYDTVGTDTAASPTTNSGMYHNSDTSVSNATLFDMEANLVANDADFANMRVVVGPRGLEAIRDLAQVANVAAIYDGVTALGYPVTKSGRVIETTAKASIYMGNFGQGLIGAKFGPLDLLVDPYSAAATAQIILHSNQWFDVDFRQGGAIATSILGA